jgi:branched-subunit amino acid transport protein
MPAVLAAIVALGLAFPDGHLDLSAHNLRLVAGLVAIVVAIFVRGNLAAIGVGMAVLWALQWLVPRIA